MIKRVLFFLFRLLLRMAAIALCLGLAGYLVLYWTGYFQPAAVVGYLYESQTQTGLDSALVKTLIESEEIHFHAAYAPEEMEKAAQKLIDDGAALLIVNLSRPPRDRRLLRTAKENGIALIFIGADPGNVYVGSYDKAWYISASPEYAGELSGGKIADAYREGTIADANGNLLLDYLSVPAAEDADEEQQAALTAALTECEHYGVFSRNLLPYVPEPEPDEAEESADPEGENADGEAADEPPAVEEPLPTLTEKWSASAAVPELIYCIGMSGAQEALAAAQMLGWLSSETPPTFAAVVDSPSDAAALDATGLFRAIVYYDTENAARYAAAMALNVLRGAYPAQGLDLAPDGTSIFMLPYLLYEK